MTGVDALRRLSPPRSGRPAYRQIEEQLLDLISDGTVRPGTRVPPERELAALLGVSRMTLRQGLDGLVRRGLLERTGGRGTFVAAPKLDQDLRRLQTLPDELRTQGVEPRTRVLGVARGTATARIAAALALGRGADVVRIERLREAAGEPFLLETSWLPAEPFAALADGDHGPSLWDALAAFGHPVVRAVERLEPVLAGAAEAALLRVAAGAALMRIERTAVAAAGPVEFAVSLVRGDRARFIVEVPTPAGRGIGHTPRP